jgi:phosphatidylglycerophosphate synthase
MQKLSYRIINGITIYRIVAAPVLVILLFTDQINIFKWLLGVSFFTDAIDGFLARKYKVTSKLGSKLDSIGDDLTMLVGIIGLFVYRYDFIKEQKVLIFILLALFLIQNVLALIRYKKMSSFHTYLAKISAVLQGSFLILMFFFPEPVYLLFYVAAAFTILDLVEEIILVLIISEWTINVKGLYWVLKKRKTSAQAN